MRGDDMTRMRGKLSQRDYGACIGRCERQIRAYENGDAEIDQTVEMASAAWLLGIRTVPEAEDIKKILDQVLRKHV